MSVCKIIIHILESDTIVLHCRKFLYSHLAQMKHLFPEAIQINRILLHDQKSLCMYADMEITLLKDAVECSNPQESPAIAICEAFRSKLLCFLGSHHKVLNLVQLLVFLCFCMTHSVTCLEHLKTSQSQFPTASSSVSSSNLLGSLFLSLIVFAV